VSIIMILSMDNSSISCSFATKYFLCGGKKKKAFLERYYFTNRVIGLTYSYLTIFHKVMMKDIMYTNLSISQFDKILSYLMWCKECSKF
jgi:hypothetical protein